MSLAFLGKKSFNPTNIKNQEKVWLAEKAHEEEQKRLEELQKQIAEEREIRELQELQGGTREDRIDWMYEGPMSGAVHAEDEAKKAEEYLLGKAFELPKQKNEEVTLAVTGGSGTLAGGGNSAANALSVGTTIKQPTANELFRRLHEDPLLRMRQAEKSSKANILSNPIKMRKIHMEADAIAKAQKKAKKAKKAAKKERKEESRKQSLGRKKRDRYDSDTPYDNEGNCGVNMRRESNRPKHRHEHRASTAREGMHRLERDKGRCELYSRRREEKDKDERDYRYGLMNCTKKVSYKAKDLGPDEDLLRKSAEKAKAEEAEKAASRVRKIAHMGHKEKAALAKEMELDGRKHEIFTAKESKEYERRKRIESDQIKMERQKGSCRHEKNGSDGHFLDKIEQAAISSSTLHGRIAARKHYQQRDQDAENFMR